MTNKILYFFLFTLATLQFALSAEEDPCKPQQIHIALSDAFTSDPATQNSIKAIFHTKEECSSAYISLKTFWGPQKISATSVNFFTEEYKAGNYSTYVHIFDFPQLEFSQTYEYSCFGSDDAFLAKPEGPFKFYLPSPNPEKDKETKVVMFADMDHSPQGMPTINALGNISQNNITEISAFIHVGDMAYNLQRYAGKNGDDYMNAIQKFTANMPYMVTAGNHENINNFSNFNMRFKMPNFEQSQNHYHSYNLGNMHFVTFNLELLILEPKLESYMLAWLEQDLQKATENRDKQPWIIAYTHRPLYCSYGNDHDCVNNHNIFEKFEKLLLQYEVDLMVAGHVHFYERMLPIKKGKVAPFQHIQDDKDFNEIINPQAPVYVLQGIAGHRGETSNPKDIYKGKDFTAKVSKTLSYLSVRSQNSTHLLVENLRSDNGAVDDHFYIIRSNSLKYAREPMVTPHDLKNSNSASLSFGNSLLALILMCLTAILL